MRASELPAGDHATYRFGVFDFDDVTVELHKSGRLVRVRPQSLKLLTLLVGRPGQLVSREEIQQALWGGETFVDFEQGVNHCIKELRSALGDVADTPRYIETLPRRGYRFIAPVERLVPTVRDVAPPSGDAESPRERPSVRSWGLIAGITIVIASALLAATICPAARIR